MNGKGAEREKEAKTYEEKKKQKERRRTKAAGPENEIKLPCFPKFLPVVCFGTTGNQESKLLSKVGSQIFLGGQLH